MIILEQVVREGYDLSDTKEAVTYNKGQKYFIHRKQHSKHRKELVPGYKAGKSLVCLRTKKDFYDPEISSEVSVQGEEDSLVHKHTWIAATYVTTASS